MDGEQGEEPSHPLRILPVAVTLAACAAFVGLGQISLPGGFNVETLGLGPIVGAFILVELIAAAMPGLRPMRASSDGRIRLWRAALGLALVIAVVQVFGILLYAEAVHLLQPPSVLRPAQVDPRLAISGGLLIGVLAAMALARLIDLAGVGAGYSILIAAASAAALARGLRQAIPETETDRAALRFFFMLGLFAVASWRMLSSPARAGSRDRYRLPTSGLEPIRQAVLIAALALGTGAARAFFWPLFPGWIQPLWVVRALQLLLTLALCRLLSRLFHRPRTDGDRAALGGAMRASERWLAGLTIASWLVIDNAVAAGSAPGGDVFSVVTLIAVGMDLARELRAGLRAGPQRVLRVVHRLEDADNLETALGAAGIESTLRGACHRALYHFFAPFIPVAVLVAEPDVERAEVAAVEHERALAAPPPLPS